MYLCEVFLCVWCVGSLSVCLSVCLKAHLTGSNAGLACQGILGRLRGNSSPGALNSWNEVESERIPFRQMPCQGDQTHTRYSIRVTEILTAD